ncbi:preprotein translocase subunit YajC [Chitinophaga sp. CB10]|uniref:preprotein translocase subunit YajC n=1 Tax=Chitinophaga sp. CB10 TaxID=1891659 RepID=UPI0025BA865E|nr:preprotein translocase subunit YajC [Chitinophaga sp. CB10]
MNMLNVLLAAPAQGGGSALPQMLIFGGMIVVMYFFMIRPQTKKAKMQKQFIENLKEGDKIVNIAGIHGKIKKFNDDGKTLVMEVAPGTTLTIERSTISMEYSAALNQPAANVKA